MRPVPLPRSIPTAVATAALAVAVGGCSTIPDLAIPALRGIPGGEGDRAIEAAREAYADGAALDALAGAEAILAEDPRHVDAHRLRQDVMRQRGRTGRLVWEAQARLEKDPDDPVALYLAGRLETDAQKQLTLFRRAGELAPDLFWPWLGLAFAARRLDSERAVDLYEQLYAQADGHPLAAVALADVQVRAGNYERATAVYSALRQSERAPGIGELGLAKTAILAEKPAAGWAPLLEALRLRPRDPDVRLLIGDAMARGLNEDRREQILDLLRADPERRDAFAEGSGQALLAELLVRAGRPQAALDVLEADGPAEEPASRRLWRRLVLAEGDVATFLRVLREDLPAPLLADETNRVRGLWLTLLDARWDGLGAASPAAEHLAFARALMAAGLLHEAEGAAQWGARLAARRGDTDGEGEIRAVLAECQKELAFEATLRRVVYKAYEGAEDGIELDAVLDAMRSVSERILGEDVVGEPERFSVPLVGEMLDPFGPGLPAHLARYNRHLTLGQRSGSLPEGMLLTRLVVRDLPEESRLPIPTRCSEVIGENREIRSLSGVYGGDLAGVALLNHYVIDLDAARVWAYELARKRSVVREDGGGLRDDPIPEGGDPLEPWDAQWRLIERSPVADEDLTLAVLDMIRWHEQAHIADFFHYLPPEANLLRNLGLVATSGFSPHGVESTMEWRAEGAALALSPHTFLVLAHICEFLKGDRDLSAHANGFATLASEIVERLREAGVAEELCLPRRWHELDPALVQRVAGELLAERY